MTSSLGFQHSKVSATSCRTCPATSTHSNGLITPSRTNAPTPWADLAAELKAAERVLCIVNTRQHAKVLYDLLGKDDATFHLSTNLCPVHRKGELEAIRERLHTGQPCRVISTQLIEAGIDVDFPVVYRALGPLEAVVQAAGRCNREGQLKDDTGRLTRGRVVVFLPEEHKLPGGDYEVRERLAGHRTA